MLRIKEILLVSVSLFSFVCQAQEDFPNLDSLYLRLANESDPTERAELFYEISDIYYYTDIDSSLHYGRQFFNAVIGGEDQELIGCGYYLLAEIYYYIDLDSADYYSQKYVTISEKMNDSLWMADAYNGRAYVLDQLGDIENTLKYFKLSLDCYQASEDSIGITMCYNNIGYALSFGTNQPEGLNYFYKSLEMATKINNSDLMSDATCNIGSYYEDINEYILAENYYKEALSLARIDGYPLDVSDIYISLATLYAEMRKSELTAAYLDSSFTYLKEVNNPYDLAMSYSAISECYLSVQNLDSARSYIFMLGGILKEHNYRLLIAEERKLYGFLLFEEQDFKRSIRLMEMALRSFEELGNMKAIPEVLEKKAEALSACGRYKEAYETMDLSKHYRDSLNMIQVSKILGSTEQHLAYSAEMRNIELEKEFAASELQHKDYRNKMNMIILGSLIIILLLSIAFGAYLIISERRRSKVLHQKNTYIQDQKLLLIERNRQLKAREEELESVNATKDKFFRIIAHDLKHPLSTITGFSELFMDGDHKFDSEEFKLIHKRMNSSATYSINLVENLLEWSMSQTGSIVPHKEKVSLESVLEKHVEDFSPAAKAKNIDIVYNRECLPLLETDSNMLSTILRNLLSNALKFSYKNSEIFVYTILHDDSVEVCIQDSGVGIANKEMDRLFQLKVRSSRKGTNNEKGTGLGLLLCKEFVERNRGAIWVESELNKGSVFHFTLPLSSN